MSSSRRDFLVRAGLTAALAVSATRAAAQGAACADPAELSLAQRSQRRALNYIEPAPDPKRHCGICAFFAATAGGCGSCQLMSGGPVSASGVCNSFAAKGR